MFWGVFPHERAKKRFVMLFAAERKKVLNSGRIDSSKHLKRKYFIPIDGKKQLKKKTSDVQNMSQIWNGIELPGKKCDVLLGNKIRNHIFVILYGVLKFKAYLFCPTGRASEAFKHFSPEWSLGVKMLFLVL